MKENIIPGEAFRSVDDKEDFNKLAAAAGSLAAAAIMFIKAYEVLKEEHGHLMDEGAYDNIENLPDELNMLVKDLSN